MNTVVLCSLAAYVAMGGDESVGSTWETGDPAPRTGPRDGRDAGDVSHPRPLDQAAHWRASAKGDKGGAG
jgi:hypothetical protein